MKRITKTICKYLLVIMTLLLSITAFTTKAETNLQIMKSGSGSDLTYRNSNEKVYGLAEYDYPTSEYRACWVSHFAGDISSYKDESSYKRDITNILDNMERMGMNAIVFHIRTHNNALYKSVLNPISHYWQNVNFDEFDPLTWIIDECHKRGIEFHAWLNPYRVSSSGISDIDELTKQFPSVNPASNKENLIITSGGVIMDPGIPEVRNFIVDTCMEIIENYEVDAIHFDDYFYVSGTNDEATRAKYNTENLSKSDFRRLQVNLFIEQLSEAMHLYNKENNKCVQLGISPSGIYRNGGYSAAPSYNSQGDLISPIASNTSGFSHYDDYLYSDTKLWIDLGWIDYITPQAYWGMEHGGANFYELTKWWSWCVAKKKTNLYMGVGIYMALGTTGSSAYWIKNQNEVKSQLLNAGMYDEISGICFYKYASLLSNNSIVQNGVNLIQNDYWAKKIPSAIVKTYADDIESYQVKNVVFNNIDNSVTWDSIDNSRGYMVYKVPKGETLDKNNIDHVYEYTQDTMVTLTDFSLYNYYIAQVNLANEISDVTVVAGEQNIVKDLIDSINRLPQTITLDNEKTVNSLRAIYNELSTTDQAKITNYQTLVKAEDKIKNLKLVKVEADNYLASINKHIEDDYLLPTSPSVSWRYLNNDDAKYYQISTGKKLMYPLQAKTITLVLSYELSDCIYETNVDFNVGYLSTSQIGLFYRDDSSCMWPDDLGQYTGDESKYIGWSNYTLTFGNSVLFIAYDNMKEITTYNTQADIPLCNWTSCAGVYRNQTNVTIPISYSQAFSSSNIYGLFVIDENGTVVTVIASTSSSSKVELKPGETLVIPRYLDKSMSNSIFCPSDGRINLNDKITLNKVVFHEVSPSDEANIVIDAINNLPNPLTLDDEVKVLEVDEEYNKLSEEAKALVTNYQVLLDAKALIQTYKKVNIVIEAIDQIPTDVTLTDQDLVVDAETLYKALTTEEKALVTNYQKLVNAINRIETLTKELIDYKSLKQTEISNYLDLQNYSNENQTVINNYINNVKTNILNAKAKETIDNYIRLAKLYLDKILTLEEELSEYKLIKKQEINNYINKSLYSETNQVSINTILTEATSQIDQALSITDIDNIISTTKSQLDLFLTLEEELSEYKINKKLNLENYVDADNYTYDNYQLIESIITNTNQLIDQALTINEVDTLYLDAVNEIDQIEQKDVTDIETYKQNAKEILNNYLNINLYSQAKQTEIDDILQQAYKAIDKLVTTQKIDDYVVLVKTRLDNIQTLEEELVVYRNKVLSDVNTYLQNLYLDSYKLLEANKIVTSFTTKLNNTSTITEIDELKTKTINELLDYKITILEAIDEAYKKVNEITNNNTQIKDLIDEVKEKLNNCSKETEVNELMEQFNTEYNNILASLKEDNNPSKCSKDKSLFYIELIVMISLLSFIIKKKD